MNTRLWKNLISAVNIIIHPSAQPTDLGVMKSVIFYYSILPIPCLILILVSAIDLWLAHQGFAAPTFWSPSLTHSTGSGSIGSVLTPTYPLLYMITYPIVGFINAGVFHLLGKKIFKIWPGSYSQTFSAVMNGFLPVALFLWLLSLPLVNLPVDSVINSLFIGIHIWNAIITIKSIQIQHHIRWQQAILGYSVGMLVIFFIMTFYYNFNITFTITKNMLQVFF